MTLARKQAFDIAYDHEIFISILHELVSQRPPADPFNGIAETQTISLADLMRKGRFPNAAATRAKE